MKTILVAVDGSEGARKAAQFAARLAHKHGARLRLLHVIEPLPEDLLASIGGHHHDIAREQLVAGQRLVEQLRDELQVPDSDAIIHKGRAGQIICLEADEHHVDMIVLGAKGTGQRSPLLLGSVGNRVANLSGRTVTIVR